jgi:predicted AlkP superfamily phosphohydrolase/phosphomutase
MGWNRVLVVGLDGANPFLINKWIEHLPTLRRLIREDFFGSTVPPTPAQTLVSWTTFMTGKNLEKHGIFSFMFRRFGTYKRDVIQPK